MGRTYMSRLTSQLVTYQGKKQFFNEMYGWHLEDAVIIHSQSVQHPTTYSHSVHLKLRQEATERQLAQIWNKLTTHLS